MIPGCITSQNYGLILFKDFASGPSASWYIMLALGEKMEASIHSSIQHTI